MIKRLSFITILVFFAWNSIAQSNIFFKFIIESDSLYKQEKYSEVINLFEKGKRNQTSEFQYRMYDYYFIACCYSKVGNIDKAFNNLSKLVDKYQYADTSIFKDKDLTNLWNDSRWVLFKNEIISNVKSVENLRLKYNGLKIKLDSLYIIDQREAASLNLENLNKYSQEGKDSINKLVFKSAQRRSVEVLKLLGNTPWLNKNVIGVQAFDMIFLSAQHSGDIKKMKALLYKYKQNRKTPVDYAHYAMLYDRIKSNSKQRQRYGTQFIINLSTGKKFYYLLEDLNRVNEYRKYCYFDTIQEDMKWHNMIKYEESTREEQDKIRE